MHVGEIITADCANGPGVRVSVFVSGCTNCCEGCFQPQTWDFEYGRLYDAQMEDFILKELSQNYYQGLSILGGEPFEPQNQPKVGQLIRRVRKELPQKTIWIYTGFTYEKDLMAGGRKYTEITDELLDNIDVLVDGKFEKELKDISLNFRGSKNQRIIDMKASRKQKRVVLSPLQENEKKF